MSGRSLRLRSSERRKSRPCSRCLLDGRASSLCSCEGEREGGRWVRWCTQPEGRWNPELEGHPPVNEEPAKTAPNQTRFAAMSCSFVPPHFPCYTTSVHAASIQVNQRLQYLVLSSPCCHHEAEASAEHVREWVGMGGACEGVGGDVRDLLVPEPGIMQVACRPTAGTAWIP